MRIMRTHMRNLSFYMHIYAEIRISDHLKFNIFVETQWLLYLLNSKCITHQKNPVFWNKWPSNADNAIGRKDLSCLQTCGVRDEVGYKKNCYAPKNDPTFHSHCSDILYIRKDVVMRCEWGREGICQLKDAPAASTNAEVTDNNSKRHGDMREEVRQEVGRITI